MRTCTSDVFQEQKDAKEKLTEHSDEMKGLEDALAKLEVEMRKNVDKMKENEKKTEETNSELQDLIRKYEEKQSSFFPRLFRALFGTFQDVSKIPGVAVKKDELTRLDSEKSSLRNQEWDIKIRQTDHQLKLATSKIQMGENFPVLLHYC